jgi:heat-inducible transcriptional repressor
MTQIRQLHMLPVSPGQALMVVVLENGVVQHRLMDLPSGLARSDLEHLSRELQTALAGCTADDLPGAVGRLWRSSLARYGDALERATVALIDVLQAGGPNGDRLYLGGTSNILNLPEFRDVERLRRVLSLLEREASMFDLLVERAAEGGVSVTIGAENRAAEIQACSLVTTTYVLPGGGRGIVGLLGPTRMDYGRVVALLGLAGCHLDQVFLE